MGIVSGTAPQEQVQGMLRLALETAERTTAAWQRTEVAFEEETAKTFDNARTLRKPGLLNFLTEPRSQYDPHTPIVFRLRDQDGTPIPISSTAFFSSPSNRVRARSRSRR